MSNVQSALTAFVENCLARYGTFYDPFDRDWRSPCEVGEPESARDGTLVIPWRPLRRGRVVADDFAPLERALELTIHPDIKSYYGAYWSGGLEAAAPEGHVSLILLWNPADADRLVENLIGHALAKRRARAAFTVFFACTEPSSELFLAVDNESGAVVLERPGDRPIRQVSPSLESFLATLEPAPPECHPERAALGLHGER
jgi:SecY interacting protein Syd